MGPAAVMIGSKVAENNKGKLPQIFREINRPVVIIIVAVIVAVAIWLIVKKIKASSAARENRDYLNAVKSNINPSETSYNGEDYRDMAQKLYDAFNGAGTRNQSWKDVFGRMRTNSDVNQLIVAFGTRKAKLFGKEYGKAMTLSEWISDELSNSEIQYLNSMLASKGITKTF